MKEFIAQLRAKLDAAAITIDGRRAAGNRLDNEALALVGDFDAFVGEVEALHIQMSRALVSYDTNALMVQNGDGGSARTFSLVGGRLSFGELENLIGLARIQATSLAKTLPLPHVAGQTMQQRIEATYTRNVAKDLAAHREWMDKAIETTKRTPTNTEGGNTDADEHR